MVLDCDVCGAKGSCNYFGAFTCEGCRAMFRKFKEQVDENPERGVCPEKGKCPVTADDRKCRPCRLKRCLEVGMSLKKSTWAIRNGIIPKFDGPTQKYPKALLLQMKKNPKAVNTKITKGSKVKQGNTKSPGRATPSNVKGTTGTDRAKSAQTKAKKKSRLSLKGVKKSANVTVDDLKANSTPDVKKAEKETETEPTEEPEMAQPTEETLTEPEEELPVPCVASLHNLGNTCFLNSILQVLRYTPLFQQRVANLTHEIKQTEKERATIAHIKQSESKKAEDQQTNEDEQILTWELVKNLNMVFKRMQITEEKFMMQSGNFIAIRPYDLMDTIERLNPMFEGNLQQDAHEFLRCLLSYVQDASRELNKYRSRQAGFDCAKSCDAIRPLFAPPNEVEMLGGSKDKSSVATATVGDSAKNIGKAKLKTRTSKRLSGGKVQPKDENHAMDNIAPADKANDGPSPKTIKSTKKRRSLTELQNHDFHIAGQKSILDCLVKKEIGDNKRNDAVITNTSTPTVVDETCKDEAKSNVSEFCDDVGVDSESSTGFLSLKGKNRGSNKRKASQSDVMDTSPPLANNSIKSEAQNTEVTEEFPDLTESKNDSKLTRKRRKCSTETCSSSTENNAASPPTQIHADTKKSGIKRLGLTRLSGGGTSKKIPNESGDMQMMDTQSSSIGQSESDDQLKMLSDNPDAQSNVEIKAAQAQAHHQDFDYQIKTECSHSQSTIDNCFNQVKPDTFQAQPHVVEVKPNPAQNVPQDNNRGEGDNKTVVAKIRTKLVLNKKQTARKTMGGSETQEVKEEADEQTLDCKKQEHTSAPSKQEQTSAPSKQAQTSGPSKQEQTSASSKQAQTSAPCKQEQTSGPSKQAQTSAPCKQEQTSATSKQEQTSAGNKQAVVKLDKNGITKYFAKVSQPQNLSDIEQRLEDVTDCIEEIFQGEVALQTRCLECETITERREDYEDISVAVHVDVQEEEDQELACKKEEVPENCETEGEKEKKNNTEECIQETPKQNKQADFEWIKTSLCEVERLRDDNKYSCDRCCRLVEAERSMHYTTVPGVLTLHLKRFAMSQGLMGGFTKLTDHVPLPMVLPCIEDNCDDPQNHSFQLYAIVTHTGFTLSCGHYTAYIRAPPDSPCLFDPDIIAQTLPKQDPPTTTTSACPPENDVADPNNNADSNNNLEGNIPDQQDSPDGSTYPDPNTVYWFECDDEVITVLREEDFLAKVAPGHSSTNTPYLLFYQRINEET